MAVRASTSVKPSQWSHWFVVGLPPGMTSLARGTRAYDGGKALQSNVDNPYYDGPCPPAGSGKHIYRLTVWALPVPSLSFAADMKATTPQAALTKVALAHASLAAYVTRQQRPILKRGNRVPDPAMEKCAVRMAARRSLNAFRLARSPRRTGAVCHGIAGLRGLASRA